MVVLLADQKVARMFDRQLVAYSIANVKPTSRLRLIEVTAGIERLVCALVTEAEQRGAGTCLYPAGWGGDGRARRDPGT